MSAVLAVTLRYRPMAPEDLDEVAQVEAQLYEFPWTRGNFSDSLAAGYSAWVLRQDGRLAAYAVTMAVLDEAHLLNISVHADWQRRGHGSALLAHLEATAQRHGATSMYLEVRPSNAQGRRLYERHGYRPIGLRRGYYPARQGREDALVMKKDL